jgi:hypothetical protein
MKALVLTALCAMAGTALAADAGKAARLDGHPDLNGTWENGSGYDFIKPQKGDKGSICVSGCKTPEGAPPPPRVRVEPDRPKYKPEFMGKVDELSKHQVENDPVLRCKAPGLPRIGPPDKIVQQKNQVVFLYDDVSGSFWRIVPLDRKHREDADPSYFGDAVGHWEGDTLVVETTNFNEDTWLTDNGAFHSDELRVVERITRSGDTMEWQATVYDPKGRVEPWKVRPRKTTLSAMELQEPVPCVEQDLKHVVDGSHHDNPR